MKNLKISPALAAIASVACVYLLLFALGITCPIKFLLGVSCPGCGMTRALFSALRLDFAAAFEYHPLWCALPPLAIVAALAHRYARRRLFWATVSLGIALLFAIYLIRIFSPSDVVVFDPQSGIVFRIIKAILP